MVIIDTEVYSNFFLFSALHVPTGAIKHYYSHNDSPLDVRSIRSLMSKYTTVSFNGNNFDLPVICYALKGATCQSIKNLSDKIIKSNLPAWRISKDLGINVPQNWNHIDLIEVAPGQSSLKIYGGRLGCSKLQDLPIGPDATIAAKQVNELIAYCENDLTTTLALYKSLEKQVDLRCSMSEQYGVDLRSKSDAQIAETVIKSELVKNHGFEFNGRHVVAVKEAFSTNEMLAANRAKEYSDQGMDYSIAHHKAAKFFGVCSSRLGYVRSQLKTMSKGRLEKKSDALHSAPLRYHDPKIINFKTPQLQSVFSKLLNTRFELNPNGSVLLPEWLKDRIIIGDTQYQMGIGGLHSCEKRRAIFRQQGEILADFDVASYYPAIILQQKLAPASLGVPFLKIYQSIVERRVAAKKSGDSVTANTLKIVVNGSFGKLGSKWSALYAPDLLIQTTITGQLALLMLIESLELAGVSVVSANTDGIVLHTSDKKAQLIEEITFDWMMSTSYELERTDYNVLASRDVNTYVAVKTDGTYKGKGAFAPSGLMKNPDFPIVYRAVSEHITTGVSVSEVIRKSTDIREFVSLRRVTGGAVWREQYLGKAVRFYYSTGVASDECISYQKNGNTVPKSAGAKPVMDLPETLPDDIDYAVYIEMAEKLRCEVGL